MATCDWNADLLACGFVLSLTRWRRQKVGQNGAGSRAWRRVRSLEVASTSCTTYSSTFSITILKYNFLPLVRFNSFLFQLYLSSIQKKMCLKDITSLKTKISEYFLFLFNFSVNKFENCQFLLFEKLNVDFEFFLMEKKIIVRRLKFALKLSCRRHDQADIKWQWKMTKSRTIKANNYYFSFIFTVIASQLYLLWSFFNHILWGLFKVNLWQSILSSYDWTQ